MVKLHRFSAVGLALVFVISAFAGMLFIPAEAEVVFTRGEIGGVFVGEEIYRSSRSLSGGMAGGDPDRDGDVEVAFCDFEGNVILLEPRDDGGFDPIFLWGVEGPQGSNKTLFDLIIADVDPDREGVEIITAGDAGSPLKNIYLIWYNGTGWESEVIFKSQFRTFDLDVADIDPAEGDPGTIGKITSWPDHVKWLAAIS